MQKNTPAYTLLMIKNVFSKVENLVMSSKVLRTITTQGVSPEDLVNLIRDLTHENFLYSILIPSDSDDGVWQDVYSTRSKMLTLKFQKTEVGRFIIC